MKGQDCAIGEASRDNPKKRVRKWLDDQATEVGKPSLTDFREVNPKGEGPLATGCAKQAKTDSNEDE